MKLPTLYSLTSTGATQEWTIEVEGDSYWTHHGQTGGKIVTSAPTVAIPTNVGRSNERNGEAQAQFEARAAWDKKKKSGGYFEDVGDIHIQKFVKPMLAHSYKDHKKKVTYPCISQCKYNGGRCVATKNGLFSRKGERYVTCEHIEESLAEFFKQWPDAVLDGELMGEGLKAALNETMKLIRRSVHITQEHLDKSREQVRFWVYDGYGFTYASKWNCYTARQQCIREILAGVPFIHDIESVICHNEVDIMNHFGKLVEDGEEGSIIRLLNEPYVNTRTHALLKLKPEDDDEAVIVDINEGTGNWAGTGKVITLAWKGQQFDATAKGEHKKAAQFLRDKEKYIGKTVTFLYLGFTGLGTPNSARVDLNNCWKS